jgi:hypothetical protein
MELMLSPGSSSLRPVVAFASVAATIPVGTALAVEAGKLFRVFRVFRG